MNPIHLEEMYKKFGISEEVLNLGNEVLADIRSRFSKIDEVAEINQLKVIHAMQKNRVSESHLHGTTGYGYNDSGRDTLEKVYADIFHTEDALVRSQITCGTHALTIALSSILRPGDELLSPVGKPYDTLEGIIGMEGTNTKGSLREFGIHYRQVDLLEDSEFDYEEIRRAINEKTKLVTIQRSKGYALRKTLSVERIGELIHFIKEIKPDVICMVDNCYGELVETIEPTDVGADLCVGSLIKNLGGGLAPMGGYLAGRKDLIELAAYRLTAPGLGKEVGASLEINPSFYQGLFQAPTVVASALKSAIFAANLYEKIGFTASPDGTEERYDIIQAIAFGSPERVIAFCQGIQQAAPVDSYVLPEPYAMPGYHSDVIMAAGAFVQGSSIELSADAPIEPPYSVFFQGGITWQHGKLGILKTLQNMVDGGFVELP
jgi:cystathionine beta-lyase family protein involved in aluminum resistance